MADEGSPGGGTRVPTTVVVVLAMAVIASVAAAASALVPGDNTTLEIQTQATSSGPTTFATPADEPSPTTGPPPTTTTTTAALDDLGDAATPRIPPSIETPPGQVGPRSYTASELGVIFGDSIVRVETAGCGTAGSGTAWAIRDQLLITNGHVVHTDMTPLVIDRDGNRFRGRVIAWFEDPDVAVISVNRVLSPLRGWADTTALVEGDPLVVIGYPRPGLDFSVLNAGIVSFRTDDNDTEGLRPAIRSDIDIDVGASGAPVLTRTGSVAGVVTEAEVDEDGRVLSTVIYTRDALSELVDEILAAEAAGETDIAAVVEGASASAGCDAFAEDTTDVPALTLVVGDCYQQTDSAETLPVAVSCEEPHDAELFHAFDAQPDDALGLYPGDEVLADSAIAGCREAFEPFVGLDFAFSQYDIEAFAPTESAWDAGDRSIRCGLYRIDQEPLIGSVEGSAS